MAWTHFWDMHSGGGNKLWRHPDGSVDDNGSSWRRKTEDIAVGHVFIEAPEGEARAVFYNRFGRNPERVTCTCCGSDYSVSTEDDLAQLTAFHRDCAFEGDRYVEKPNRYSEAAVSLEDYLARPDIHVIRASDIADTERTAQLPVEGYVWA